MLVLILEAALWPGARCGGATLAVNPSSLTIEAGASETVSVSAAAEANGKILDPSLTVSVPSGLRYDILRAPEPGAPTGGLTWLVALTVDPAATGESVATLSLDYRDGVGSGLSVATATLKVTPKPAATVASVVGAEIVEDGDTLLDGRDGVMLLKLTNLSDAALTITQIRFFQSDLLEQSAFTPPPWPLPPRGSIVERVKVGIRPDQPLITGKHPIGAVIAVERDGPGRPWSGELMVSKDISAGVPGMSELQTLVQVPSFLFLPGFLIVTAFVMVRRSARSALPASTPPQSVVASFAWTWSPALWVVAITLSGMVIFIYPDIMQVLTPVRRNVLYGFDLADVIRIWLGCVLFGAFAAGFSLVVHKIRVAYKASRAFAANEQPQDFLERLARMKLSHQFPYVSQAGEPGRRLYRLDPADNRDMVWAAPAMKIDVEAAFKDNFDKVPISDAADAPDLGTLLGLLDKALDQHQIRLRWDNFGEVNSPAEVKRDSFDGIKTTRSKSIVGFN